MLLTVIIVVVTMALVLRRVIQPLGELLSCADRARRGDFSGRTRFAGNDELGRLGAAPNLMAENLSQMYGALEELVAKKTRDLERTNHSLELLYRISKTLSEEPVSEPLLHRVLADIQDDMETGAVTLCLRQDESMPRGTLLVTTRPRSGQTSPCWDQGCRACLDLEQPRSFSIVLDQGLSRRVRSFPVQDRDQRFGVLLIDLPADGDLEPWQQRLLAALAGHIGTALNLQQRGRVSRRLVLHEERSIIARELHDSLAQSLSYLKIQVTRLSAALNDPSDPRAPDEEIHVLQIVREALSSVIRHANAQHAGVRLQQSGNRVEVEIWDDGRGMGEPADRAGHDGANIMRERTRSLEGEISTESSPEGGTRVRVRFPHRTARGPDSSGDIGSGAMH